MIPGTKAGRQYYVETALKQGCIDKMCPSFNPTAKLKSSVSAPLQNPDLRVSAIHTGGFNDEDAACRCLKYPKCSHYPYHYTTGVSRVMHVIYLSLVITALILCTYAFACGAVSRGGFDLANTGRNGTQSSERDYANSTIHSTNGSVVSNYNTALSPGHKLIYIGIFQLLPIQLAYSFAIAFLPLLDTHLRFTQPFMGMYRGSNSRDTVALNYLTLSSLQVPLDAYSAGL